MVTTPGKDAVIRWIEETTPGTFPTNPVLKLFSKETLRVGLTLDKGQQESLDIGNVDVEEYFQTVNTYGVQVECHVYDADRIFDFLARNADNSIKAYSFEYIPDQTATTKHYYRMNGWRLASLELSASVGEPWTATFDFALGTITPSVTADPGIGTGSRELKSAFTGIAANIKTFASGAITLDAATWATLVGSLSVTFENDVGDPKRTAGQADPVTNLAIGGTRRITGSADISMDDGGDAQWDRVVAGIAHTIRVAFGATTGHELLDLTGVKWPNMELESNLDDQVMMGGQEFMATGFVRSLVP